MPQLFWYNLNNRVCLHIHEVSIVCRVQSLSDSFRSGDTAVVGAHWDDGEDVNAVA